MKFDKSKVYTALNADELKVGNKVIVADDLETLKEHVKYGGEGVIKTITKIRVEAEESRFECNNATFAWNLAYLIEGSGKLKWTDLKVGDIITFGGHTAMVTEIDNDKGTDMHIYAGHRWHTDEDLEGWKKGRERMNNVAHYYCQALQAEEITKDQIIAYCACIIDSMDVNEIGKELYARSKNFREICRMHRVSGRKLGRSEQ